MAEMNMTRKKSVENDISLEAKVREVRSNVLAR